MLKLNKKNSECFFLAKRSSPKVNILVAHRKGRIQALNIQKKPILLERVGKSLSFSRAFSGALKQNQWSSLDCRFLLQHLMDLQEQLYSLPCKSPDHVEVKFNKELLEEANAIRKAVLTSITDAIIALNAANSKKLECALDVAIKELELLFRILQKSQIKGVNVEY